MKKKIRNILHNKYIITVIIIFGLVIIAPELQNLGKVHPAEGSNDIQVERTSQFREIIPTDKTAEGKPEVKKEQEEERNDKEKEIALDKKKDKDNEDQAKTIEIEIPSKIKVNEPSKTKPAKKESTKKDYRPNIREKEEVKTKSINFKTIKKNNDKLTKGKEKLEREGQKGSRTIVYKVTYTDGKETGRVEVSNTVTKKPVDKVVSIGTKQEASPAKKTNSRDLPSNYTYNYYGGLEDYMIRLINDYRASKGLNKLEKRNDLTKSARYKSNSMLQLNYFAHSNPNLGNNNSSYLIRTAFGYSHYSGTGENLTASGTGGRSNADLERAFKRFQASDSHNKNMLNPQWRYIGVGVLGSNSSGSKFGGAPAFIITQHFGR